MPEKKGRLLLIDDEPKLLQSLSMIFEGEGYAVDVARMGEEGEKLFRQRKYDLVLTDLMMPDQTGIDLMKKLLEVDPDASIMLMTAYGTVETAVEAMKIGAIDYIPKPFSVEEITLRVGRIVEGLKVRRENRRLKQYMRDIDARFEPVYKSEALRAIFSQIDDIADSDLTVLLMGDSGVGKEIVARYVHRKSDRAREPFVVVNCTVLSEGLIESELFGHEKGAFTGAIRLKLGKVEVADGGTLFLDEIGELPISVQAKLLRFLQDHQFERVGGTKTLFSNVRVVAATNKNLEEEVEGKRFREDLYYRLSVIPIFIPPLAARPEDILPLAYHFFDRASQKLSATAKRISPEAEELLVRYPWPGNVRELENAIERAVILTKTESLTRESFAFLNKERRTDERPSDFSLGNNEKFLIEKALSRTHGNILQSAKLLEISRTTLYSKIEKHGIDISRFGNDRK
jgi:DNA-binding NtrC family response regulator